MKKKITEHEKRSIKNMTNPKLSKVKKVKDEEIYEKYEDEEDEESPAGPSLQVNLNVLAEGRYFCLLKDKVSKDVFSVERGIQGVYLNLLRKGRR